MLDETIFDDSRKKTLSGNISLEEMLSDTREVAELRKKYRDLFELEFALTMYSLVLPRNLPLDEKFKAIDLNLKLKRRLMETKPKYDLGNGFEINYNSNYRPRHIESPLEFEIKYNGERIGSFNYYLMRGGKKPLMRINNIQGTADKKGELAKLSQMLGVNWRLGIAKFLKTFGDGKGFLVVGDLPPIFTMKTDKYRTVIRDYIRTYLDAGIELIDSHNCAAFSHEAQIMILDMKENRKKSQKEIARHKKWVEYKANKKPK